MTHTDKVPIATDGPPSPTRARLDPGNGSLPAADPGPLEGSRQGRRQGGRIDASKRKRGGGQRL